MTRSAARQLTNIAGLLLLIAIGHRALAATGPQRPVHFTIEAGRVSVTLEKFCKQAGLQFAYTSPSVPNVTTHAVRGDFVPEHALKLMIEGTGLTFSFSDEKTITLSFEAPDQRTSPDAGPARDPDRHDSRKDGQPTVTVQADRLSARTSLAEATIILDREAIDATGLSTVADFVRTLPQIFGGGPTEDTFQNGTEAATNLARGYGINLRGLDAGSTLVLINGRRLAVGGSEGAFVDVSSLPLLAVERIEILPVSSSTRFGADGAGGTVNFVMRRAFPGAMTTAVVGTTTRFDLSENAISQVFGGKTASGEGLIALDFSSRSALAAARRAQVTSDLTRFGGDDFDLPFGSPGTLMVGTTTWAIPAGQDGTHLDMGSLRPASRNESDRWAGADVLPSQQRWSAFGTWRNQLTDSISMFADGFTTQRSMRGNGAPIAVNLLVPTSNPFRVTPVPAAPATVGYSFINELGSTTTDATVKTENIASGLEWNPTPAWHLVGTAAYASERMSVDVRNELDRTAALAALADPNPATALNLFGDGSGNNPATISRLRTSSLMESWSSLRSLEITANGPLGHWAGRDVRLLTGAGLREQRFATSTMQTRTAAASLAGLRRTVTSAFAEARLPALQRLELSVGGRYEKYSHFGDSLTPRYALEWVPAHGMMLRASWSRAFRMPTLIDTNESANAVTFMTLPDPSAPGGRAPVLVWTGRNADLRKERANTWTAGLELTSDLVPGLSIAATYFDVDFKDRLTFPELTSDVLTNERYRDMVIRNPTEAQLDLVCGRSPIVEFAGTCRGTPIRNIVDIRLRNDVEMQTRGVDFVSQFARETPHGTVSIGLTGTYIIDFKEAKSRTQPLQDIVSTQNAPIDLRCRGRLGWQRGPLEMNAFVNFANKYWDVASEPHREIHSLTTFDTNVGYTWKSTTLSLSAENVFDQDPPFLNNAVGVGYDQENADVIGRFVSVTLRQRW